MYPVSQQYIDAIQSTTRTKAIKAEIQTGTATYNLTDAEIQQNSCKVQRQSLPSSSLVLGDVSSAMLDLTILNTAGRFDNVQFNGTVIRPFDGTELADGTIEWVPLGVFTVTSASRPTTTIAIEASDNLSKLDFSFNDLGMSFPATNLEILTAICRHAGVTLKTTDFLNSDYTVASAPESSMTGRDVVSDIAEMACCFARCTLDTGELELAWFENPKYVTEVVLDGGNFTDYSTGDIVDGGDFIWYSNKSYDGGILGVAASPVVSLGPGNRYDYKIDDFPVIVTGVRFDTSDTNYLIGSDYYSVDISQNALIADDDIQTVLSSLADRLIGFTYQPFTSNWQGNPALQPGDMILQTDRNGVTYRTIITNSTYVYRGRCSLAAQAESLSQQGYQTTTKKMAQLTRSVAQKQQQIDQLNDTISQATSLIAGALGGYAVQGTGKYEGNYFIADNPDITKAKKVWRWSLGGFGYSTTGPDGPFTTAVTADGSIIAAIITANMIKTGKLQGLNSADYIDLDSGSFSLGGGALTYDPVNGFNCVAAKKVNTAESPDTYLIIGWDNNIGGLHLFCNGVNFCDIISYGNPPNGFKLQLPDGSYGFYCDSNGIRFLHGDNSVGFSGWTTAGNQKLNYIEGLMTSVEQAFDTFSGQTAQGFNFTNGIFQGGGPASVLNGTISLGNGHSITITGGMVTGYN